MDDYSDIQAVIDQVTKTQHASIASIKDRGLDVPVFVLSAADGVHINSVKKLVDEYLPYPERRRGTATLQRLDSFIALTNRFKLPESALFATFQKLGSAALQAVFDYNQPTDAPENHANWAGHRAAYNFPLSEEWKAWTAKNGQMMDQKEFAEFLEDRVLDILPAPVFNMDSDADLAASNTVKALGGVVAGPDRIMTLSRGLTVYANTVVKNAVVLNSGETSIQFEETHVDSNGQALTVPSLFFIGIPVFENDIGYRMLIRLRYRRGASIKWFFEMHRADVVFRDAFETACNAAATETGLPLLYGSPEAS